MNLENQQPVYVNAEILEETSKQKTPMSDADKMNRKWFSGFGWHYLFLTIIIMLVQVASAYVGSNFLPDLYEKYAMLFNMIPMYVIGFPIAYLFIGRQKPTKISKQDFSIGKVALAWVISVGAMQAGNMIGNALNVGLSALAQSEANNQVADIIMETQVWQNFIVVVICAPIIEELFFRKFIVERMIKFGEMTAIIISGFMFAMFHGNVIQFSYAFLLGMVFAYVYIKSGRLIYTIVLHMLINFMGSILSVFILQKTDILNVLAKLSEAGENAADVLMSNVGPLAIYFAYAGFIMMVGMAGIILFFVFINKYNIQKGEIQLEKGKRFKTIFLNPGMIAYSIVWIIMMVAAILA